MHIWNDWQEAWDWCRWNASEDCSVLTSNWTSNRVSILKYERFGTSGNFFFRGFAMNVLVTK